MLQFLSHVQQDIPADGDPIALAIVLVIVLAFVVWVMADKRKKASVQEEAPAPAAPAVEPAKAPGAAGQLKLHSVDPKTAAMLMAIVADKMGKPLNELRFVSIKEVERYEI